MDGGIIGCILCSSCDYFGVIDRSGIDFWISCGGVVNFFFIVGLLWMVGNDCLCY